MSDVAKIVSDIKNGKINFDVAVATPNEIIAKINRKPSVKGNAASIKTPKVVAMILCPNEIKTN